MKRKIAVVTGSRAEYGLLYWTMKEIQKSENLKLQLIVTGMHLSDDFGATYKHILDDGFIINKEIDIQVKDDTSQGIAKSMGFGMIGFAQAYKELKPDILLVLGDRYEILAAVSAALPFNIPIAHISGGENTEGAIDNQIRHAITKIAHIHFPGADLYAENLKKSGEEQWRIFNVGDPGIENIRKTRVIPRDTLYKLLNIDTNKRTFLVTLHPATLNNAVQEKIESEIFFNVLKGYENMNVIITYPNSDVNGQIIINEIRKMQKLSNVKVFKNLGSRNYISLMKECDLVLGNSSSGLIEAPFLKKPVIDYGDRQKGRLRADNIIHVNANSDELSSAIKKALNDKYFAEKVRNTESLYGEGETSDQIVKILKNISIDKKLLCKKIIFKGAENE